MREFCNLVKYELRLQWILFKFKVRIHYDLSKMYWENKLGL